MLIIKLYKTGKKMNKNKIHYQSLQTAIIRVPLQIISNSFVATSYIREEDDYYFYITHNIESMKKKYYIYIFFMTTNVTRNED